jgi:hypothetical protein
MNGFDAQMCGLFLSRAYGSSSREPGVAFDSAVVCETRHSTCCELACVLRCQSTDIHTGVPKRSCAGDGGMLNDVLLLCDR